MKYLRKIFESNFTEKEVDELKDLCEGIFAYLLDENFHIRITKHNKNVLVDDDVFLQIEIYKNNFVYPDHLFITNTKPFDWEEISDYFINLYQQLKNNYIIKTNWDNSVVKFNYIKMGARKEYFEEKSILNNNIERENISVVTINIEKK
jgi:hypothetical protein